MNIVLAFVLVLSAALVSSDALLIVCTRDGCYDRSRNEISCNFGNLSTEVLLIEASEVFLTPQSQRVFKVDQFVAVSSGVLSVDLQFLRRPNGNGIGSVGIAALGGIRRAGGPGVVRQDTVGGKSMRMSASGKDRNEYVCIDSKPRERTRLTPFGLCCTSCF